MNSHLIGALVACGSVFAVPPLEATLRVQHEAVGCVLAERHPWLEARFEPASEVARARAFFRAADTPHWYSVEMAAQAGLWSGVLPKPRRSAARIEYYLEATDKAFVPVRTSEHAAEVVGTASGCRKDVPIAAASPQARVVVTAAAGAPAVPAGFLDAGLLAAGGGLSTGVIAGILGGGAAAVAGVMVARDGEGERPEETPIIAGSWVGTGADGLRRDMIRVVAPINCRREDDLFLDLQQSGRTVTGTARYVSRAGTTCDQEPLGTVRSFDVTGFLDGTAVSLTLLVALADGPSTHVLIGTLAASRMGGTATSTLPGATGQGTWSVRRP